MTGLGERLQGAAYAAGWGLVRALPESLARTSFRAGADLAFRRNGAGIRQLRRNYARVVPQAGPEELDELVRAGVRSYSRFWMETFRLSGMDHEAIHRHVQERVVGLSLVEAARERGKGTVFVLPHTGNFDISGIWLVGYQGRFTTVNERLKPESVYQRFVGHRESLGFEILPTGGGAYRTLLARLRENKAICLLADRDLSRRGVPVNFFGEQTRMPEGPARLAAATGAQILVVENTFTDGPDGPGWGLRFHSPILVSGRDEVPSATQKIADGFAADIAANPADWHMMQKLWLADLPADRLAALRGKPEEASESR